MTNHDTENFTAEVLTDDQLEFVSAGAALYATDPTNPLCPEPRPFPGQTLSHHKG